MVNRDKLLDASTLSQKTEVPDELVSNVVDTNRLAIQKDQGVIE